jgi:hypothetical protein
LDRVIYNDDIYQILKNFLIHQLIDYLFFSFIIKYFYFYIYMVDFDEDISNEILKTIYDNIFTFWQINEYGVFKDVL